RGCNSRPGREQFRLFEQPAEILLAGLVQRPFLVAEVGHRLVGHGEPLQSHDADVFMSRFPDLALAEFHSVKPKSVSPDFVSKETAFRGRLLLLFLGGGLFSSGFLSFFSCHSFYFYWFD